MRKFMCVGVGVRRWVGVGMGVGRSDGMCVCVCVKMLLYLHLRSDQVILSGRQVGRHFKATRSNSHSCRH